MTMTNHLWMRLITLYWHRSVYSLRDPRQDTDLHSTMQGIRSKRQAQKTQAPATTENREPGMSAKMVALWRRADDNVDSSTKMVALIEYLREWDASGDNNHRLLTMYA